MKPYIQRGEQNLRRVVMLQRRVIYKPFPMPKIVTVDEIQKKVAEYYHVPVDMLDSNTRKREIVQTRQIAHYFATLMTKTSLTEIGNKIGKKDHATVLHSCKTVSNLIETDKIFNLQIIEIDKRLRGEC